MNACKGFLVLGLLVLSPAFPRAESLSHEVNTGIERIKGGAPESSVVAAMDVLKITNAQQNMLLLLDLFSAPIFNIVKASSPNISEQVLSEFKTQFRQEMQAQLPALMRSQAELYAMHFSESELRELAVFYRTPLGQKMLKETPAIMKEASAIGQVWGRQAGRDAMLKVIDRMRKIGIKI